MFKSESYRVDIVLFINLNHRCSTFKEHGGLKAAICFAKCRKGNP